MLGLPFGVKICIICYIVLTTIVTILLGTDDDFGIWEGFKMSQCFYFGLMGVGVFVWGLVLLWKYIL
jgi:hypothetical protein